MMSRRPFRLAEPALALLVLAGSGLGAAHAQAPLRFTVTPALGLLDPHGDVPSAPILDDGVIGYDDFGATGALGAVLEVGVGTLPVGLRASAVRSLPRSETGQWSCAPVDQPVACPGILIRVATDVTVTSLGLDLTGRIPLGPLGLHPTVGMGWLRYGYSWNAGTVGAFSLEPGEASANDAVVRAGVGLSVPLLVGARLKADWLEMMAGGDLHRSRPRRLSVFSLGTELAVGR